jgi:hypothetical protein
LVGFFICYAASMDWAKLDGTAVAIIFATFMGPVAAIQVQKFLEWRQEKYRFKRNIFRTLMATRATPLAAEHVQALNGIELAFYNRSPYWGKKNREVLRAWLAYHTHLKTLPKDPNDRPANLAWSNKKVDLLVALLCQMAKCLRYDFDETYIANSWYKPDDHVDTELEQRTIRAALKDMLTGKRWLMVAQVPQADLDAAAKLRAASPAPVPPSPPAALPPAK